MKMPKPPAGAKPPTVRHGSPKPAIRLRKIKLQGRSAYGGQKAAFGPRDPLMGAPSAQLPGPGADPIGPPVAGAAGPGETDS